MNEPSTQYATDVNLAARQRLWASARRDRPFDLFTWVLDLAELRGDEHILDVGCGNGAYEARLAERGHAGAAISLDLSFGMQPMVQADAQVLPFPADAFDVVLAPHMLYHVPDVGQAAQEMRRVLRPHGVLVAVTNSSRNLEELVRLVEDAVGSGWRMTRPADMSFSLENGAEQLAGSFSSVSVVAAPSGTIVVEDADVVADYVASTGDLYGPGVTLGWDDVVGRVRSAAAAQVSAHGGVRSTSAVGAFVCRD